MPGNDACPWIPICKQKKVTFEYKMWLHKMQTVAYPCPKKKLEVLSQENTYSRYRLRIYCLCMENGGREKDFEGRVTYNRRRGETSMSGIKAHTRVQPVSQRRPELISPQLQQEQPAENRTSFTIRWLVAGLPFFTSIEMHTRITFQSTLI